MKKLIVRKRAKKATRFGVTDKDVTIIKSTKNREASEKNSS